LIHPFVSLKQLLFLSHENWMNSTLPCYSSTRKYGFPLKKFCDQTLVSSFPHLVENSVQHLFFSSALCCRQVCLPLSASQEDGGMWRSYQNKLSDTIPNTFSITPAKPFHTSHSFQIPSQEPHSLLDRHKNLRYTTSDLLCATTCSLFTTAIRLYAFDKKRISGRIFIKFGTDAMPFETTPNSYILFSFSQ
jgi:hypothetical protein